MNHLQSQIIQYESMQGHRVPTVRRFFNFIQGGMMRYKIPLDIENMSFDDEEFKPKPKSSCDLSEIIDNKLYLGSLDGAFCKLSCLKEYGITHVFHIAPPIGAKGKGHVESKGSAPSICLG